MVVIDVHHHWMPEDVVQNIEKHLRPDERADREGERVWLRRGEMELLTIDRLYHDLPTHLQHMDEAGVDMAVLSTACWQEWNNMAMAPAINEAVAEAQARRPDRIIGLAHVPPFGEGAVEELERAVKALGLRGACLTCSFDGKYLDEPEYRPFYAKAQELDIPIVVHASTAPLEHRQLIRHNLNRTLGRAFDQALVTTRLLYSGILGDFPNLRFVIGHLGGMFHILRYRLIDTLPIQRIPPLPYDVYLKQLYFDTGPARHFKKEMECALETLGADQILLGSDYPVSHDLIRRAMAMMSELELPAEEEQKIMGATAARLFKVI